MGGLEALDVENLRRHYARTLNLWVNNFEEQSTLIKNTVSPETYRIWRIYLAGCAFAFERDDVSIYQILCRKSGSNANKLDWSRRYMYP